MKARKIFLVYDVEGWAFDSTCRDIVRYAPEEYDLCAVAEAEFSRVPLVEVNQAAGVLYFSWYALTQRITTRQIYLVANHGCQYDPWPCRGRGDCDHKQDFWPAVCATTSRNRSHAVRQFPHVEGIICVNRQLAEFAVQLNPQAIFLPIGIDGEVFRPAKQLSLDRSVKLKVGWCGQLDDPPFPNQKGYEWVFQPVRERCADFCSFQVNTRNYRSALDRQAMVDWYNSLDVFLCTSISEGTPSTAMEALCCGRPVVTTGVGDMPQLIRDRETGFLTGCYHDSKSAAAVIEQTCQALQQLHWDRELLRHMGQQARVVMLQTRNWRSLASQWLRVIAGD